MVNAPSLLVCQLVGFFFLQDVLLHKFCYDDVALIFITTSTWKHFEHFLRTMKLNLTNPSNPDNNSIDLTFSIRIQYSYIATNHGNIDAWNSRSTPRYC